MFAMSAYTPLGVFFCLILVLLKDYSVTCDQVRLVGGSKPHEGRLEILKPHDRWRAMCYNGFAYTEAKLVCSLLGYDITDSKSYNPPDAPYFRGESLYYYRIRNRGCRGHERHFSECSFSKVNCQREGPQCCTERDQVRVSCLRRTYDCGLNNPCHPSLATPGKRAYAHTDKNQITQCIPGQNGKHACVTSKCPSGTEYDPVAGRCFSYEAFDCVSRNPCHLVAQTSQTIYRHSGTFYWFHNGYAQCVLQKDGTNKCVTGKCSFSFWGIIDIATQSCV